MHRLREVFLWLGASLGVLCIGWAVAIFAFGLTPLVFTSGSMSPEIKAGDLGIAKTVAADDIRVGDIISVVNDQGVRITHRAVSVEPADRGVTLVMKGDANKQADAESYAVADNAERVEFSVPKAGYLLTAVSSPVGMFVGGLIAAAALFIAFSRRSDDDERGSTARQGGGARKQRRASVGRRSNRAAERGAGVLASGLVSLVLIAVTVQPTSAAWADTAAVATGTLNTTMLDPGQITCSGGGPGASTIELRWTHVDARYDYRVVTRDENGAKLQDIHVPGTGTARTTSLSVTVSRSRNWGLGWYDHTATVMSKLKSSPTWLSTGTVYQYSEGRIGASSSIYCG